MILGLEKVDSVAGDAVDEAVLEGDAAGETAFEDALEGSGPSIARGWMEDGFFDESEDAVGDGWIGFGPVAKVVPEFGMEDRIRQGRSPRVVVPLTLFCLCRGRRDRFRA